MPKYVSFLRGVNVGGHKVIKMEHLKKMFQNFKLENVSTFIQSGNVLFESPEKNQLKLNKKIEESLLLELGYEVEVFTRSEAELEKIINKIPFKGVEPDKRTKIYIMFLNENPDPGKSASLEELSYDAESFRVSGKEVYVLVYKDKIKQKAVFTNNLAEKKLGLPGTTRDYNTISKIDFLLKHNE